jgi:uncharacterized protein (DUF2141 family)
MHFTTFLALTLAAAGIGSPSHAADTARAPAANSGAASVTITLTGMEVPKGRIMVALYDSKEAFEGGSPVRVTPVPVADTADVSSVIEGLVPGAYAVKAFHDVDGDGKMAKNPFGIPIEPFAFSNDAKGERGPASWESAAFAVAGGTNAHRITIR